MGVEWQAKRQKLKDDAEETSMGKTTKSEPHGILKAKIKTAIAESGKKFREDR